MTETDYRARLLAGMAEAIAEIGYADLTIADIVRRARVSKRTFYEHFATKEACLVALYEQEAGRLVAIIAAAIADVPPGEERIAVGTRVYFESLALSPRIAKTLLVEILHAGAAGSAARRDVLRRFAELFVAEFAAAGKQHVLPAAVATAVATALVGGINELVLQASEDDRLDQVDVLSAAVATLVRAVMRTGGAAERST